MVIILDLGEKFSMFGSSPKGGKLFRVSQELAKYMAGDDSVTPTITDTFTDTNKEIKPS